MKRIEMRVFFLVELLGVSLFMPLASAHGANDFSIIMRTSSIQPSEAEVLQNDSVADGEGIIFYPNMRGGESFVSIFDVPADYADFQICSHMHP